MSTQANAPTPDKAAILNALSVMFEPNDVIELRAFHKGKKRTDAGYFDGEHRDELANAAAALSKSNAAVYVTLNQIDPQLLGRYCNRLEQFAADTATDANVIRRRWLLIDLDPERPKNTAASDAQLQKAKDKAWTCFNLLQDKGWPKPVVAESGNGMHLLYPLDLPNDTETRDLVKGALAGLAALIDGDGVKVDQAVFNAGRITKLYGTVANKGDHTESAPWRLSKLVRMPERTVTVTVEQLRDLHPVKSDPVKPHQASQPQGSFNLPDFMGRLGIAYEVDQHEGRDRYKLQHCPFNPEHGKGEAAVFQNASGAIGFKCQHDSCADKHWQEVRALIDGSKEQRGQYQHASYGASTPHQGDGENAPAGDDNEWPEPQPLTAKIEPEPYPLEALPDSILAAVKEVVGFVQSPVAMVASSALTALSLAIQALMDAKRAEKLHGPVGLYLLTIADSGERKSTSDGFFTKPIHAYEQAQAELFKPVLKDYRADLDSWTAKCGGVKEKIRQLAKEQKPTASLEAILREYEHDKPEPPRIPRLLFSDITPEALGYQLAKGWPSAGIVSSEAGAVLGSHGMGKDSAMRNLATLNLLWDGNTISSERRSVESWTARGARLTVALQIQEPTLREFLTKSGQLARGSGFLARFLIAWPGSTQGMRPFSDPPANWPHLAAFHRRLEAILNQPVPIDDDGALTPPLMPLDPNAKAAWVEYHNAIESQLASGGELYDLRDVASKSADNAARLAALFQMFEHGTGGAIGADAFERASCITAWHLHEARRFFGELALPAELADAARLDSWVIEHCKRERTPLVGKRTALQYGPLRKKENLDAAIRELVDLDRLRVEKDGKRLTLHLNPALLIVGGTV
ncbi:MAG: YfjI family protein [Rhodocyclaceae bacterium]|nr:YfjI family protein [Rhodocyclaceae bacterium]